MGVSDYWTLLRFTASQKLFLASLPSLLPHEYTGDTRCCAFVTS